MLESPRAEQWSPVRQESRIYFVTLLNRTVYCESYSKKAHAGARPARMAHLSREACLGRPPSSREHKGHSLAVSCHFSQLCRRECGKKMAEPCMVTAVAHPSTAARSVARFTRGVRSSSAL